MTDPTINSRTPQQGSPFEDEGLADPGSREPGDILGADPDDTMSVPAEEAVAVDDYGTTGAEEAAGESLDGRLARELPDPPLELGADQPAGRLVAPDEGAREDTETDEVGTDVGTDQGGFSAEESAMHIEPEV